MTSARVSKNQSHTGRVADGRLLQARIEYAAAALPELSRRAFQLGSSNGWDARAIANDLGISYNAARQHLTRARQRVRAALERDGYDVPKALLPGRRGGRKES